MYCFKASGLRISRIKLYMIDETSSVEDSTNSGKNKVLLTDSGHQEARDFVSLAKTNLFPRGPQNTVIFCPNKEVWNTSCEYFLVRSAMNSWGPDNANFILSPITGHPLDPGGTFAFDFWKMKKKRNRDTTTITNASIYVNMLMTSSLSIARFRYQLYSAARGLL